MEKKLEGEWVNIYFFIMESQLDPRRKGTYERFVVLLTIYGIYASAVWGYAYSECGKTCPCFLFNYGVGAFWLWDMFDFFNDKFVMGGLAFMHMISLFFFFDTAIVASFGRLDGFWPFFRLFILLFVCLFIYYFVRSHIVHMLMWETLALYMAVIFVFALDHQNKHMLTVEVI